MRAPAIVVLLLLAVPVADAAWSWISYRETVGAGWHAESFQLGANSTRLWVSFDVMSSGEITGHLLALYTDTGTLLRGSTFFSEGGQIVEATLASGGAVVTNEVVEQTADEGYFAGEVFWTCDAACNPSRKFTLVVATGGDVLGWRYALLTNAGGNTPIANTSGPEANAITTRHFDGDVAHVQTPVRGVHRVVAGTHEAHADGTMLTTFVKPNPSPDPRVMRVDGPASAACPCFAGDWGAGDYTFRYEDLDINGVEGLLVYADVAMP